jgi:hypothetical protein
MRIAHSITASVACLTIISVAAEAGSITFAPHRAIYDITLDRADTGSGVDAVSGRMVYEFNGSACEGYTQNMRFVSRMVNQDGAETLNDLRNSSFEDAAGKSLRFSSTQYQDEKIAEASQGDAGRPSATGPANVDLVKPAKKQVPLPEGVHFPMQHAVALIEAAKRGDRIFRADLYDGSEKGDKYYTTIAAIGALKPQTPVETAAAKSALDRLAEQSSWPMSISYFEPGKDKIDALPSYELSVRYYENGVTGDLKINYGEFAIKGELKELKMLDAAPCEAGGR